MKAKDLIKKFINKNGNPSPYIFIDPYTDDVYNEKKIDWGKDKNEAHTRLQASMDEI